MADFHFTIKYRPGRENGDADALSRMPLDVESLMRECSEELPPDTIAATIQAVEVQKEAVVPWSFSAASMSVSAEGETTTATTSSIPKMGLEKHKNLIQSSVLCSISNCRVPNRQLKSKRNSVQRQNAYSENGTN